MGAGPARCYAPSAAREDGWSYIVFAASFVPPAIADRACTGLSSPIARPRSARKDRTSMCWFAPPASMNRRNDSRRAWPAGPQPVDRALRESRRLFEPRAAVLAVSLRGLEERGRL